MMENNLYTPAYKPIDARTRQRMRESRTPGLVLGLTDRDNLLRVSAYGYAELESKAPTHPETPFQIGSISKTFAAVVAMRSVEAGSLNLHAPVVEYLPWFELRSNFSPITIHHLLSHSGGLPYSMDFSPDPHAIVYALRNFEVPHAPGERFHYSEVGYQILTLILEKIHGKSYADILGEQIFKPLGMDNSFSVITHNLRPELARGYTTLYDDRPVQNSHPIVPAPWIEFNSCDGAVASTAGDMSKFIRMLLNLGSPLISRESFNLMLTEVVPGWGYGYGLISWEDKGVHYMGHAGDMPGYEAQMWMDITNHLGVVLLSSLLAPNNLVWEVLHSLQAVRHSAPLPAFETTSDPALTHPEDYAGTYREGNRTLDIVAENDGLFLSFDGMNLPVEWHGPDSFLVRHPAFDRFPLVFNRMEGDQNTIIGLIHGPEYYIREGNPIPEYPGFPPEWKAFAGHYRSWNPWESNFRVILRQGGLILVHPDGEEEPLHPRRDGGFRVGLDELTPESIHFDQVVEGHALRATLSGVDYYRFFTP